MPNKPVDYTNKKFNKLTAINFSHSERKPWGRNIRYWSFKCDCGSLCIKESAKVAFGDIKHCGCENKKKLQGEEHVAYAVFQDSYDDGDLTFEDFKWLSQQDCYLCSQWRPKTRKHRSKVDVSFSYHGLDRVDNSRSHDRDNVQPCCWPCNEMKKDKSLQEFLGEIEAIYKNRCAW
jgi:hypothetical protein